MDSSVPTGQLVARPFIMRPRCPLAAAELHLSSPLDYQVVQRRTLNRGTVPLIGTDGSHVDGAICLETRFVAEGRPSPWIRLDAPTSKGQFRCSLEMPAGGWFRLEVRQRKGDSVVAQTHIEHLGIGEVFVVTGQSNSANHGEELQKPQSGLVTTFDGTGWRPALDPQPGASGGGGSFLPPFGDALSKRLGVPVGLVACGIGATSVREWLPKGSRFPNPPTLTHHVRRLESGEWESDGAAALSSVSEWSGRPVSAGLIVPTVAGRTLLRSLQS